jgi:formate hydrogenlyase subunit 3/multisubunit Na+/H+ antiporter MnhD subunit
VNHWIIAPVVLPAVLGAATVLAGSLSHRVYRLGDWPAPFGIVLVLDRLSALMLVLTAALALVGAGSGHRHRLGHPRPQVPCAVAVSS